MRKKWIRLVLIAATVLLLPAAAMAQATSPAAPATLKLTASPAMKGMVQLEARLTGSDGKPLGMQKVSFQLGTAFFGERLVHLGDEITDGAGVATFQYMPSWDGDQQLQARFAGSPGSAPAVAKATFAVTGTSPALRPHAAEASPLVPVWRLTGVAAAAVTTVVWLLLIGSVVVVRMGIDRLAGRRERAPLPAAEPSYSKGD